MKVLLLGKPELFNIMGGDRVQIEQTAENLRLLGVDVDIKTGIVKDLDKYDIVHVFQLDWNLESYFQIKEAKKHGKLVVFSPIHHSVAELKKFDDEYVFDFRRLSKILFKDQFNRDLFKEFYRSLFKPSRLWIVLYAALHGVKNMSISSLKNSDVILVQTVREADDLKKTFNLDLKCEVVKNGVSKIYIDRDFSNETSPLGYSNYILCVGRIEPRKNQLSVIEAVESIRREEKLDLKLVFIGSKAKNKHFEYTSIFDRKVKSNNWISYISHVDYVKMPVYYHFAKVGVSASWFETTGLTSIEALFCGANAVAAGERAKEYLGDYVSYCDPSSVASIKQAILKEYLAPQPQLDDNLKTEYTWENAAKTTLAVYNKILESK
jgi:glycosyltransferase involved in cell wall biosynthesis